MSRINLDTQHVPTASQALLEQVHRTFGATPNMFKAVSNSPAALQSMWGAFAALGKGKLGAALGEQIAVAVANRNACDYCLAAHTVIGQQAGVSGDALISAQTGQSSDPKTAAALKFALAVVSERGRVGASDIEALRAVGFDDGAVVEIVAHVALNLFTNYINVALDVPLDFPHVARR